MDEDQALAFIRRRMAEVGEPVDDMTDHQLHARCRSQLSAWPKQSAGGPTSTTPVPQRPSGYPP
jgi:hypothetical protein